jgi:Domain of unknown function (DUF4145)
VSINRTVWKVSFMTDNAIKWPCPKCGTGFLKLDNETFKIRQQAIPPGFDPKEWDPRMITYTYSGIFTCTNESCKEPFSSCGRGEIIEDYYEDDDNNANAGYEDWFTPEYFFPSLAIFSIPRKCPETIATEIRLSFHLFFCDPAAAANHIRKSIENILTEKGIKRFHRNNGRRTVISLHQRIQLYAAKDKDVAERLFAIKWLGNAGSHAGELTKDDVLDAYEILETVLDDLYIGHGKLIKKKVSLLNKTKRPIRKRNK